MNFKNLRIRKFTPEGSDKFRSLVERRDADMETAIASLIVDNDLTVILQGEIIVRPMKFRIELAESLWGSFGADQPLHNQRSDRHLWNWISAALLAPLLEADSRESRDAKLGKEIERWILTENTLRYHRHLVSGPFFAYEANYPNVKDAMCQLATTILAPGELVERIAGKRSLSTGSVCKLATLLYYDSESRELRSGHTSKPGNPKAFGRYFSQVDRTLDYEGMEVGELLKLLPSNFSKWVDFAKKELSM